MKYNINYIIYNYGLSAYLMLYVIPVVCYVPASVVMCHEFLQIIFYWLVVCRLCIQSERNVVPLCWHVVVSIVNMNYFVLWRCTIRICCTSYSGQYNLSPNKGNYIKCSNNTGNSDHQKFSWLENSYNKFRQMTYWMLIKNLKHY